jgi:hypothetical protein
MCVGQSRTFNNDVDSFISKGYDLPNAYRLARDANQQVFQRLVGGLATGLGSFTQFDIHELAYSLIDAIKNFIASPPIFDAIKDWWTEEHGNHIVPQQLSSQPRASPTDEPLQSLYPESSSLDSSPIVDRRPPEIETPPPWSPAEGPQSLSNDYQNVSPPDFSADGLQSGPIISAAADSSSIFDNISHPATSLFEENLDCRPPDFSTSSASDVWGASQAASEPPGLSSAPDLRPVELPTSVEPFDTLGGPTMSDSWASESLDTSGPDSPQPGAFQTDAR